MGPASPRAGRKGGGGGCVLFHPSFPLFSFVPFIESVLPNLPKCVGMRAARQELDAPAAARHRLTCRVLYSLRPLSQLGLAALRFPRWWEDTLGRKGKIEEWLLARNPNTRAPPRDFHPTFASLVPSTLLLRCTLQPFRETLLALRSFLLYISFGGGRLVCCKHAVASGRRLQQNGLASRGLLRTVRFPRLSLSLSL